MSHNPERRLSYGPSLSTDPLWLKAIDRVSDGLDRGTQRLFSSMAAVARGGLYVLDGLTSLVDRLVPASTENGGNSLLSIIDKIEERRERLVVRKLSRAKNKNN